MKIYKVQSEELLERLVYERLDDLIENDELKHKQVYEKSEAQTKLTNVGKQLFSYWYDYYSDFLEDYLENDDDDIIDDDDDLEELSPKAIKKLEDDFNFIMDTPSTSENKVMMIDPPGGWLYGFPKELPKDLPKDEFLNWIVANGYPKDEIDKLGDYFHCRFWEVSKSS